jgi:tetratricopeptide (TPR) repeat protein
MSDANKKASYLDWSNAFTEECAALFLINGDAAFAASNYDKAIDLYSAAIELNSASDVVFAKRSMAKSEKMLWDDALLDAHKTIELNPSSHAGYRVKHIALRGAQRFDEAIESFEIMLSKLDNAPEAQIRELRQQYVSRSEAEDAIRKAVCIELENAPLRLLNTSTGLLCNRVGQINSFKTSPEYKELLSFTTKHSDFRTERIKNMVATYFRCVLLSHRWEETEVLLHDIQDKAVHELNEIGGIVKLQSFCKIAHNAGYLWAWMDTCCIDKSSNVELQESVNSMFVWYRHSALTIVYLCDVPPSSPPGALARSAWNKRGWTFQEFVAPKVVIFLSQGLVIIS